MRGFSPANARKLETRMRPRTAHRRIAPPRPNIVILSSQGRHLGRNKSSTPSVRWQPEFPRPFEGVALVRPLRCEEVKLRPLANLIELMMEQDLTVFKYGN